MYIYCDPGVGIDCGRFASWVADFVRPCAPSAVYLKWQQSVLLHRVMQCSPHVQTRPMVILHAAQLQQHMHSLRRLWLRCPRLVPFPLFGVASGSAVDVSPAEAYKERQRLLSVPRERCGSYRQIQQYHLCRLRKYLFRWKRHSHPPTTGERLKVVQSLYL